ncbi:MAG TPA: ABC transporter ATP-binding protein [Nocardioidaceae bacterium]|nr:ABC transporter ATP-binding protein [Nocardioidaceae bacterium]
MTTDVIRLTDISKRFVLRKDKSLKERVVNFRRSARFKDDFWALDGVNLSVESGTTVGLVGPNGSGKSTLLKTIGGIIRPTRGVVERRGRLAALIEIGAGFHPDLTGRENVFLNSSILGLTPRQTERWFDDIVAFSGIERFIDTQVKFYSSGMYVRLAFAVAVHVDPDVLLVDEVLAVGDEPFQRKCLDRIRRFQSEGRTIVLVSHALEQVGELCDRAVVLEGGRVVVDGDPRDALRTLRADYETVRQEEQRKAQGAGDGTDATPAEAARVEGLRIAAPSGDAVESLKPGEDVIVEIDVHAIEPLTDWMLGTGLDTPLGQVVYGTNTDMLGERMPDLAAGQRRTFRIQLPDLRLGEGEYFVHGALAKASGEEIHRLAQAVMVSVHSVGDSVGVVDVRGRLLR